MKRPSTPYILLAFKNKNTQQSRFPDTESPFFTDMGEELWTTIKRNAAQPISKEEILRRIAGQKKDEEGK